jgi:ABC-type sugar transport system substrate-binding protein
VYLFQRKRLSAIAVLPLLLAACSSTAATPTPAAPATQGQPTAAATVAASTVASAPAVDLHGKKVGVIELYNNPYWVDAEKGIRGVLEPLGVTITTVNSNGVPQTQATNVTNFISAGLDGVIMGPVSPTGAVADAQRLQTAGIPLVCGDSCVPDAQVQALSKGWATSAGADLGSGVGKAAAAYIQSTLGGNANIGMIVCDSLGPVCSVRHDAITAALATVPNAKVVASQDAFQTDKAEPLVVNMLTAHPEINIIITNNQGGTEGATAAVKQLNLQGKVWVFGIDMTNVAANYLLESPPVLMYTVGQDSLGVGKAAAQMMVQVLSKQPVDPAKVVVSVQEFPRSDTAKINQYLKDHQGQ